MNADEFREQGKQVVDFIADYFANVDESVPYPSVEPGYLKSLLPSEAPQEGENFDTIMDDLKQHIMIGHTHWNHPFFMAYYPTPNTIPSNLGEMLCNALSVQASNWSTSPAATELEVLVTDWMAQALGLPDAFMSESKCGGGAILANSSEGTIVSLVVSRKMKIEEYCQKHPTCSVYDAFAKLVTYMSAEAHSSVEKAGLIGAVRMTPVPTNEHHQMCTKTLNEYISRDLDNGLIPFYICASVGTTNSCACDNLDEIGQVAQKYDMWLHVDGAYAGMAAVCPENQYIFHGISRVSSVSVNAHKWGLISFDCSFFFCQRMKQIEEFMGTTGGSGISNPFPPLPPNMPEFGNRQLSYSRRMRAMKAWFTMRMYGLDGMRQYIRQHIELAKLLEKLFLDDPEFEIVEKVNFGLVCFRKKGSNILNKNLLEAILEDGRITVVPAMFSDSDTYFIRVSMNYSHLTEEHVRKAFEIIKNISTKQNQQNVTKLQNDDSVI